MFLFPIICIVIGFILLLGSIFMFLMDYKYVLIHNVRRNYLIFNVSSLILSILLLIFGVIYFFVIKNQL